MTKSKNVRSAPAVPRAEQLVQASKMRACLLAYFNNRQGWYTAKDIVIHLESQIAEIGYVPHQVMYQLQSLALNKQMQMTKHEGVMHYASIKETLMPDDETEINASDSQIQHSNLEDLAVKSKAKVNVSAKVAPQQLDPMLIKIDIVKATGAVCILTQGLKIEICVV